MSAIAVAIGGSALLGAGASAYSANKASKAMDKAAQAAQIDIDEVDAQTRRIAKQNALDSAALEAQLTPEVPELRRTANRGVISALNDTSSGRYASTLEAGLGSELDTPLLREAIAKARSDLALGGRLSTDVQNAVTRRGLENAGMAGGGLGFGRDVVARDLGLTSYDVESKRLATALGAGEQEQGLATDNASNLLNKIQMLNAIDTQRKNYALGAAQYGESIAQPIVGLDPSAVANMKAGAASNASAAYANQANVAGAQGNSMMNMVGQLGGAFLQYKGATKKP